MPTAVVFFFKFWFQIFVESVLSEALFAVWHLSSKCARKSFWAWPVKTIWGGRAADDGTEQEKQPWKRREEIKPPRRVLRLIKARLGFLKCHHRTHETGTWLSNHSNKVSHGQDFSFERNSRVPKDDRDLSQPFRGDSQQTTKTKSPMRFARNLNCGCSCVPCGPTL